MREKVEGQETLRGRRVRLTPPGSPYRGSHPSTTARRARPARSRCACRVRYPPYIPPSPPARLMIVSGDCWRRRGT